MRNKIYCQSCRKYVRFDDDQQVILVQHPCCTCSNCSGDCCQSGKTVESSTIPSWHPQHICGIYCDGQDGSSSQCALEKRKGPPDVIEQLANVAK